MSNISFDFKEYRIHYFLEPSGDKFMLEELNFKEKVEPYIQPDNSDKIQNEISGSNNLNSDTNNSANIQRDSKLRNNDINVPNPNDSQYKTFIQSGNYKLIIGIAMYSEDTELIESTLDGICNNLEDLNGKGIKSNEILILIISDGREKVNKEVYSKFTEMKVHSVEGKIDKHMKTIFEDKAYKDKKPNYLISCLTKFVKVNRMGEESQRNGNRSEMDILFSIKKENRGKLDSHYWLFLGFCKQINPKYVILLDTGTVPTRKISLSSLILPMDHDDFIVGTCGEMTLNNKHSCMNLTLCAQMLEYKYAHVVDKNFESLFGYISVLPGAFSAYRWKSLNHSKTLEEYFRTIGNDKADCEMANRYLAEDRIFCWVLFAMQGESNILRFIPDAQASTDAPETYGEFMLQRRRWINGSNFAMFYVLKKYPEICSSKHFIRQFFFFFIYIYYVIQAIIGYCIMGTFYFVYYMICEKNFEKDSASTGIIMTGFLCIIVFTIIWSLSIKPERDVSVNKQTNEEKIKFKQKSGFVVLSILLGVYNLIGFIFAIYTIFKGGLTNPDKNRYKTVDEYYQAYKEYWGALILIVISLSNFLLPLLYQPSMICLWVQNFVQYILFQPTYAIILNVFAVCNIDDVSWGNRDSKAHSKAKNFKQYKINFLTVWLIANIAVGWGFSYVVTNPQSIALGRDKVLINAYSILLAILSAFKLICAMMGKFKYYVIDKWYKGYLKGVIPNVNNNNNNGDFQAGMINDANLDVQNFDNNNNQSEIKEKYKEGDIIQQNDYLDQERIDVEDDDVENRNHNEIYQDRSKKYFQNNNIIIIDDEKKGLNNVNPDLGEDDIEYNTNANIYKEDERKNNLNSKYSPPS